jgi:hypothetical protein
MRLTTTATDRERYPDREQYSCERCRMTAYKDGSGAHYIPAAHVGSSVSPYAIPAARVRSSVSPYAITAPTDPALERRDRVWRRKYRRPKDA